MKKLVIASIAAVVVGLSATTAFAQTETGQAEVTVTAGSLGIHSFPASFQFEDYALGGADAALNLKAPFELALEDYTGSYAGWNLTMTVADLQSGADILSSPSLTSDFSLATINDANPDGTKGAADTSQVGTFTSYSGIIAFGAPKKILSAQANNPEAASRHYFTFPAESLELSFLNDTKSGSYAGVNTFALVATP